MWFLYALLLAFSSPADRPAAAQTAGSDLSACAVAAIRDFEAQVTVEKADLPQLEKINKDFGIIYRLREVTVRYKDPDKFRLDNRLGVFIVNGSMRYIRVPQLRLRKKDDLGGDLSKRYSLLDIGIVTPSRLEQLHWRYLKQETVQGRPMPAFEVSFSEDDPDRFIVCMDTEKKHVARRQWLDREGKLRATFDYLQPVEVTPGVWVPSRIEVRNSDGVLAGAAKYSELKVNCAPPDSLFEPDEK